ncbi:DUF6318 family protein [Jonesia quinghaiensis]|uniref:DUF6318 family protein n=1 Tax=Jonesia quinghaiensis TaxID=262806 RepID=UPI000A005204|nr:DUF6318 family protein [Jonesia quinghaiensis]
MFSSIRRNGFGVGSARLIGGVIVGGLLLAGCGGADESPAPAPSTQVEQEPTPTETKETAVPETADPEERPVPEEPEAMKTGDKAGAIAAAKFFVEVIEYDMHTSTTDLLEKYSYEKCNMCIEYQKTIEKRNKDGIKVISSDYEIKDLGSVSLWGKKQLTWEVPLELSVREEYVNYDEQYHADHSLLFYVTYLPEGWVFTEVTPASAQ